MLQHKYFDLWLHSSEELSELLSIRVLRRETLHEWPLSSVELLHLENGEKMIYKAQYVEGVEAEFYDRARSPLLPWHKNLGTFEQTTAMLFECFEMPRMDMLDLSERDRVEHGKRILDAIAGIQGELPFYQDLGTATLWRQYVSDTLDKLIQLIETGIFEQTDQETVGRLARRVARADVLALFNTPARLIHADLGNDNIFITGDGYRVIDWQYPRRAPAEVDWACYLDGVDIDPLKYASPAAVGVFYFIRLNWLVECKRRLFPQGESYDQQVAELARSILGT